jgi:hypothetical protein
MKQKKELLKIGWRICNDLLFGDSECENKQRLYIYIYKHGCWCFNLLVKVKKQKRKAGTIYYSIVLRHVGRWRKYGCLKFHESVCFYMSQEIVTLSVVRELQRCCPCVVRHIIRTDQRAGWYFLVPVCGCVLWVQVGGNVSWNDTVELRNSAVRVGAAIPCYRAAGVADSDACLPSCVRPSGREVL